MNLFFYQPQSQVRELTLDDNFLTSASNYFLSFFFLFTINKRLMACYFPQSPVQFTSRVLGVLGGDTENISVLGTGIPKTRGYPKH